jgi:hypothetical protein
MKSSRMRWIVHLAHTEEKLNAPDVLVGKPEGRGLLGKLRCRLADNIKMDLRER